MANVRLDVGYQIKDGTQLSFYAPCDFKEIEKLVIYYPSNGEVASHVFTFKDAQGNDLTDFNELFAKDACVTVILSVSKSSAYIQNAPTSGVHTAIGSNLSLMGTKAGGLKLVNMKGATKQKTLSGKNLFDIEGWLANLGIKYTKNNNTITVTNADNPSGIYLIASPSKAYKISKEDIEMTVSVKSISGLVSGVNPRITIVNSNGTIVKEMGSGSKATVVGNRIMINYSSTDITGAGVSISDVQVERGSIVTPYEPYCGGIPSPNPDYPQAIENVGDCVEMMIGYYNTSNGVYSSNSAYVCTKHKIPCKTGDVIKIETEPKLLRRFVFFNGENYIGYDNSQSEDANSYSIVIPNNIDNFVFYLADSSKAITPQTVGKISLTVNGKHVVQFVEHGKNLFDVSKATNVTKISNNEIRMGAHVSPIYDYHFKEKTQYTFSAYVKNALDENSSTLGNLRIKIKYTDGTSVDALTNNTTTYKYLTFVSDVNKTISNIIGYFGGGGYLYIKDFQIEEGSVATQYEPYTEKVATIFLDEPLREGDRLVKVDGVWNVERNVINENITTSAYMVKLADGYQTENTNIFFASFGKKTVGSKILCSHFTDAKVFEYNNDNIGMQVNDTNNYVYFRINQQMTLEEFKTWCVDNDVIVEYELAEETYTPLDTESQLVLNRLKTFNDVTHIKIDSVVEAEAEFKYGKTETVASALTAELLGHETMLTVKGRVANNLTTTEEGFVLDARQGKALFDLYTELANRITTLESNQ